MEILASFDTLSVIAFNPRSFSFTFESRVSALLFVMDLSMKTLINMKTKTIVISISIKKRVFISV